MTELTLHTQINGYVLYKDIICGIGTIKGEERLEKNRIFYVMEVSISLK